MEQSRAAEGEEKALKAETERVNEVRTLFYHTSMKAQMNMMERADQEVASKVKSQMYEIGKVRKRKRMRISRCTGHSCLVTGAVAFVLGTGWRRHNQCFLFVVLCAVLCFQSSGF